MPFHYTSLSCLFIIPLHYAFSLYGHTTVLHWLARENIKPLTFPLPQIFEWRCLHLHCGSDCSQLQEIYKDKPSSHQNQSSLYSKSYEYLFVLLNGIRSFRLKYFHLKRYLILSYWFRFSF